MFSAAAATEEWRDFWKWRTEISSPLSQIVVVRITVKTGCFGATDVMWLARQAPDGLFFLCTTITIDQTGF